MTTVDDAIEAGARALSEHWRDMHTNGSLDRQRDLAGHAARAMWPILSAGLRKLHRRYTIYDWDGACPDASEAHTEAHHHEAHVGDWYCDTLPIGSVCDSCCDDDGDRMDWPCPTVRELDRIDRELEL